MRALELLAPARTAQIGKAAIDCGADAVYLAGPAFGARQAAGNSVEDIAELCTYAHRFGARVFVTVNTLVYEEELSQAEQLIHALDAAGADALIVQDPAVVQLAAGTSLALHASTQCAIRTPEDARFMESLGYVRLVLERQLSLEQIARIAGSVEAEIECFVHGALCVCYSGQCYLSEYLTGRSANRGACAQPCRSLYDLQDASGRTLVRNKALLSLKDFRLLERLEDLAEAGACSFKIEGRLKSESYVRNVVRAYDQALNALVRQHPDRYVRASFGRVQDGFTPDLEKSFNRGYTTLFLDGERQPHWSSMDAPTSLGAYVGRVEKVTPEGVQVKPAGPELRFANGDGLSYVTASGQVEGFRADVVKGFFLQCKPERTLRPGMALYRNLDTVFEKQLAANPPRRELSVHLFVEVDGGVRVRAVSEDGRDVQAQLDGPDPAQKADMVLQTLRSQLGKRSAPYRFEVSDVAVNGPVPFLTVGAVNALRRDLAARLDAAPSCPAPTGHPAPSCPAPTGHLAQVGGDGVLTYKANIANSLTRALYAARGVREQEPAYELTHRPDAELMRSKYCVRYELGLCPRLQKGIKAEPLYLLNGGKRLRLDFHCKECEMTLSTC